MRADASFFEIILASLLLLLSPLAQAHALPLGDGKVSQAPMSGYVYSCMQTFRGGGAQHAGSWIQGSTWDPDKKIHVEGKVLWQDAKFSISIQGNSRIVAGNGLPVDEPTGIFPVQENDPAYSIDRNPNRIETQALSFFLPLDPQIAQSASCVPMGMIGVALDGVPFFNALDAEGRDAVAHEVQDLCNGHPQRNGEYHYHGPSPCIPNANGNNKLIGYALDGFGIYSSRDENGRELTNADLDACHGRTSPVEWNGKTVNMYHYVLTREYPYTIGCFRGTPVQAAAMRMPPGRRRPPMEALKACEGLSASDACGFLSPRGDQISGRCLTLGDRLACVPFRR